MRAVKYSQLSQFFMRNRKTIVSSVGAVIMLALGVFLVLNLNIFHDLFGVHSSPHGAHSSPHGAHSDPHGAHSSPQGGNASTDGSHSLIGEIKYHDEILVFTALLSMSLLIVLARVFISQRREVRKRTQAEMLARELAHQDPLTGLANRRQFDEKLNAAMAAPPRAGSAHAVMALDLNGFKKVNDVYGHSAGDDLLVKVAHRIDEAVRDVDIVARLGGDEFAVLSTQLNGADDATNIARRIIKAFVAPIKIGSAVHHVGVGIGIALFPQDGATPDELLRRADIALYRAKADPQSTMCFFEEEMDVAVRERDMVQRDLHDAIQSGMIVPFYQPIVDLNTSQIVEFEALARWTHPTLGEIPPSRFIAIAEDCGEIAALTDHLLRRACTDALQWPSHISLSFNVSPVELKSPSLGLRILSILAQTGLPPARLEIELTESAIVRDLQAAQLILTALRAAGVRIALDDFGTGYSSLYHLRNFKVDKIKIDRSFVSNLETEPESGALVRALLGLGGGLGLKVTAEGIEDAQQHSILKSAGCELGQGYLFGRAVAPEEALSLFTRQPLITAFKAATR